MPTASAPTLAQFRQRLRPYQQDVVDDALATYDRDPYGRTLYASPCATGKGTVELALLKALRERERDAWILTPTLEVVRGFLERCGGHPEGMSGDALAAAAEDIYVTTPMRLRNKVLRGECGMPEIVIYDEVHHATEDNEVSGTLFAVAPDACWFGFTATPYRGSPRATQALRDAWPDVVEVYNVPDAATDGWITLPTFRVVPLLDDDVVKVVGGEFQTQALNKEMKGRVDALADLVADTWAPHAACNEGEAGLERTCPAVTRLPTVVAVPSSEVASWLVDALDARGVEGDWVSAKTPARERALAYSRCRSGESVLLSINVVTEGFDMPELSRIIDARPTQSPVSWMQLIGRVMRNKPDGSRGEYICICRNLERHAYLLQGALPREQFAEAQEAFEKPSDRDTRARVGLESLRRFKAIPLPLADGVKGYMYSLYSVDSEGVKTEYVTLLDPCGAEPICASRSVARLPDGEAYDYRNAPKWQRCTVPDDLVGFATSGHRFELTDKQRTWWQRSAARHGLDPGAVDDITWRQFSALPVLSNLGARI